MMNPSHFWIATFVLAAATFAMRFSFFYLEGRWDMPRALRRGLRFIPPAVLSALVAPMLLLHGENALGLSSWPRLVAGALAVLVAWRTKHMLLTIASGLGTLWVLEWLIR